MFSRYQSYGFTMLELIIAIGIIAVMAAVGGGLYINYISTAESATVMDQIRMIEEKTGVAIATDNDGLVQCDNTLVAMSDLSASNLELSLASVPLDPADLSAGDALVLVIAARVDDHGGTGIELAKTLHEELSNSTSRVEGATLTDSVVTFTLRLSDGAACDSAAAVAQAPRNAASLSSNPAWTNAPPPTAYTKPSAPTASDQLPACNAGEELSIMFVNGKPEQVCTKACGENQRLDAAGSCVASNVPPAMCNGVCEDIYPGDCSSDFAGMCGESFVTDICPLTCGICSTANPPQVKCSDLNFITGTSPEAPSMVSWTPRFKGMLPRTAGEPVTLDEDELIALMRITSPDGSSPMRVTAIDFGGTAFLKTSRNADGKWEIDLPSGVVALPGAGARITVDNGRGSTVVPTVWSTW